MPDMERVVDDLRLHVAKTPEDKAFVKGFIEGKDRARKEIVFILFVVLLVVTIWAKVL